MAPSQGLSYKNGMPSRTGSSSRSRQLNEKLMIKSQMASTGLLKTPAYPSVDSQNYAGPGVHVKEDAWERQALVSKHRLLSSSRPQPEGSERGAGEMAPQHLGEMELGSQHQHDEASVTANPCNPSSKWGRDRRIPGACWFPAFLPDT